MSTKKYNKSTHTPAVKPFADHLSELRGRLAWVALVFIIASALAYSIREPLVSIVLAPIGDQKLVYLTPAGGFSFIFQVTMYVGMLATAPIGIYHLYRFVSPALPGRMRSMSIRVVIVSTLLMLLGVGFGYFVAIPAALQFLTAFAGDFIEANLTADSYLSFVVAYVLGLGLLFQLPLLLVFWNWIQPFKPGGLLATQRYVLVGAFIAAAMITPTPDVLNQCLIAIPIIVIYQFGVLAVFMMNRKQLRADRQTIDVPTLQPGKPVLTNNFAHIPRSVDIVSAIEQHTPAAQPTVTRPVVAKVQPKLGVSVDGFYRKSRSPSVGIPQRNQTSLRPALTRPARGRPAPQGLPRTQTNIDGFTFV